MFASAAYKSYSDVYETASRAGKSGQFADDRLFAQVSGGLESGIKAGGGFASAAGHGPFSSSYKSPDGPFGNIQLSFQGQYADIDIDIGNLKARNPAAALIGGVVHTGEVVWNLISGTTTDQNIVRKILIADPKVGITPSPDGKFNRK
ncbi:hypothetical protein [Bryobacter aggregatus]|uniref:hypothetical protein n=1 Tax=Bryobacter aggregatus TaxID=360054 RepID=UPI0012BA6BA8|nr:hypothetical protein [Bryobacter aggregatus]